MNMLQQALIHVEEGALKLQREAGLGAATDSSVLDLKLGEGEGLRSRPHLRIYMSRIISSMSLQRISSISCQTLDHDVGRFDESCGRIPFFQVELPVPHKTVSVFNSHSKANETYSGVPPGGYSLR